MFDYNAKVVHIVDGDTMDVEVDVGFHMTAKVRVRLVGVDTPEVYGPNACEEGREASAFVKQLLPLGQEVLLTTQKAGKYGRWLAILVMPDGRCVNDILIEKGWEYTK